MLNGVLALHDVDDVERYCAYLLRRTHHVDDYEDALTWAIERTWKLSLRYDPGRGSSFKNYVARSVRFADYLRERDGRTRWTLSNGYVYERKRPTFVPLDQLPERGAEDEPEGLLDLLGIGPGSR